MSYDTLLLDITDGLATVTLNRPEAANALDPVMSAELRAVAIKLSHDASVRAVLLTAAGKVFCGGGDLGSFASVDPEELPAVIDAMTVDLHAGLARFAKMDAPLVTAVTGSAGGAGMSLIAASDLVVAGAERAKFTMGYTAAGLSPDGTSTFFLARVVGLRRAMDLVLTNRVLSAAEAEAWGLVNRVVADDAVLGEARALAERLAAGPTKAFGLAKRSVIEGANSSLEAAMERESASISTAARTADAIEGINAFLAKRRPSYTGR
ncbi:MAG: enoyl-CoA hydratase-related protein [Acidimicrobiia bacterium]|nr:enoyl-CoA hydratase-related protein [Acidimicrobiia bacterium]